MLKVMHREDVPCESHSSVPYLHEPASIALILCRYNRSSFLPIKNLISGGGIHRKAILIKEPSCKGNTLKDLRIGYLVNPYP